MELKLKHKKYPATIEGLDKLIKDSKKQKFDRNFDIGFWSLMVILMLTGTIKEYALLKMACCTMTSKGVKFVMQK